MRITHLSTDFLPCIGGVTQHIVEVTRALADSGHEIEVIAPDPTNDLRCLNKPSYREELGAVSIFRIPYVINRSVRFVSGQITSRISDARFCRLMLDRLAESKPDLVHWHAIESRRVPMADWSRSARVWTNHTSQFIFGIENESRRRRYQWEAEQADEIIVPSEELGDLTARLGYPPQRIHFISNGVDSKRFSPSNSGELWRSRLGLCSADRLVLCPRRPEKKNGVSYALKAIGRLLEKGEPNLHFAVSGSFAGPRSDSEEEELRTIVETSPFREKLHLLGRVENADMAGLYAAASIVVMPSLMEATSLSAMEAMATGKAVVSTNVGGLPFLIRDGENGFLVPPRDPDALAGGIERILHDPRLAESMGKAGRKRVEEELDWFAIARQVETVYEKALARFGGSRSSIRK